VDAINKKEAERDAVQSGPTAADVLEEMATSTNFRSSLANAARISLENYRLYDALA
jgi:hypothetical protein